MLHDERNTEKNLKTLLERTEDIQKDCRRTERPGLYIMILITMCAAISTCERVTNMYTLQKENVRGNSYPEEFYIINGKRAYISIDGQPIDPVEKEQ
ncbi:MAG: hypothetical protein Q7R96_03340 [Nanoarchaeota archaeon]|nr:hypothetical protein [Nanoarchaeota archaeon]